MSGYLGKILYVDLSKEFISTYTLKPETYREWLGGSGLSAYLMDNLLKDKLGFLDPFDPENPLIFMTGPLTGTYLTGSSRVSVSALSPLTGIWGESHAGGFLGKEIKAAGYDGIIVTGRAKQPVVLYIEEEICLKETPELWGLDTYETYDRIRGNGSYQVAAIGPAGENQVLYASIIHNKGHAFGRTGMGAVMGSKNLKAIAVKGEQKTPVKDEIAFSKLRRDLLEKSKNSLAIQMLTSFGTNGTLEIGHLSGDVPIKGWQEGEWDEGVESLGAFSYNEKILKGNRSCFACSVACKRDVADPINPNKKAPGPEYETVAGFGTLLFNRDLELVASANDLCNRLGLDTISASSTIATAIRMSEDGLWDESNELSWDNPHVILTILEKIAAREDIGDILADGTSRLVARFNARHLDLTVKNLEVPYHDPRAYHGLGLAYATGNRGACHVSCLTLNIELGASIYQSIDIPDDFQGQTSVGKAKLVKEAQDLGSVFLAASGFCQLGSIPFDESDLQSALAAVTGKEYSLEELRSIGERIWQKKREINETRKVDKSADKLPDIFFRAQENGGAKGSTPDIDLLLKEYWQLRE